MRHLGINFSIRKNLKSNNVRRYNVTYKEAHKICVLFTADGNEKFLAINNLIELLTNDGKQVDVLYLLNKEVDKPDVGLDDQMVKLDKKEISFFGNIGNNNVERQLKERYDYFIHADTETTIYSDLLMALSQAKCRIGAFHEDKGAFYDFMIKIDNERNLQDLLKQIYHYTKSI